MSAARVFQKYETVVVTRTDAGAEAQRKLYEKLTEQMEKAGAKHVRFELWGKRRLAFPIGKSLKGLYLYYVYLADGDFVKDLNRTLKLSTIVLRYLTVRIGEDINPETFDYEKEKQFDALPTEAEEAEHRPMTGWESEYPATRARPEAESDEDEDDERAARREQAERGDKDEEG